ncbi:MAG TPA: hypothetical protein DCR93_15295 [Cytophagales bacterium]|nr:hypothetical protein [Cytophagales bacterium]
MSYGTYTQTSTYTVVDVRKAFEGFEADFRMIALRTKKMEEKKVEDLIHDVMAFAENFYLESVSIALLNTEDDEPVSAVKFSVNDAGSASTSERAGKNRDWPDLPETYLTLIISHTQKWNNLTSQQQKNFYSNQGFKNSWSPTNINNSFPSLNSHRGQLYASKGYELQKQNFS